MLRSLIILTVLSYSAVAFSPSAPQLLSSSASSRVLGARNLAMLAESECAQPSAPQPLSRRALVLRSLGAGVLAGGSGMLGAGEVRAEGAQKKLTGLSNEELKAKILEDVTKRQFLVTGDLTREIYDEKCTFKDEIDTYSIDKWIDGTGKLFKNDYSHIDLDGPVTVTEKEAKFRFNERLMFNIPLLYPKVPLTGELTLTRGEDGLITSYQEKWDQPVWKVLLSAKF